jgi:hypothetical protein
MLKAWGRVERSCRGTLLMSARMGRNPSGAPCLSEKQNLQRSADAADKTFYSCHTHTHHSFIECSIEAGNLLSGNGG